MDYIKFEKKPQYFHSCDGHWSEIGNLFAADIFLNTTTQISKLIY